MIKISTEGYENYHLDLATRPLTDFIDDFSVWYLRRSRDRFKEEDVDKKDALATLRYVLLSLSKVMAPSMPFFAEYVFQKTREEKEFESVHLMSWPKTIKQSKLDLEVIKQMSAVRTVVNLALAERIEKGVKVKQPLASLKIKRNEVLTGKNKDLLNLIKDEINVKEIIFDSKIEKETELDLNLTEELKEEGVVREIIRFAQDGRKNAGLNPADEIIANFFGDETLIRILEKNKAVIKKEIKARDIVTKSILEGSDEFSKKEILIDAKKLNLFIKKI